MLAHVICERLGDVPLQTHAYTHTRSTTHTLLTHHINALALYHTTLSIGNENRNRYLIVFVLDRTNELNWSNN